MAINGKERHKVEHALRYEQEYKGGSALTIRKHFDTWGRFPYDRENGYPVKTPHGNLEVRTWVYSYGTPIAWVTVHGTVVIPDESYSVTTSGHQGLCRAYLGRRGS